MTSFESNPMDALAGLLEERRRYEGWLAQLEARRADSPSHVVDRVRGDYSGRLDAVTQKLRDRAEELEASAAGLRARIEALQGEESQRRDERAELELRALVGEYQPDQAQSSIAACDEAIGHLMGERSTLEAELSRITEVLALVAPPPLPPIESPSSEASMPEEPAAVAEGAVNHDQGEPLQTQEMATASALETASLSTTAEPSPMDELAFLHSVVDAPREEHAPVSAEPSVPRAESSADLLPPPVLTAPRRPVTPLSTSIPTTRDPFASTAKVSSLTPGSIPSFLKDMPTEQVKTLKCQECGTMNYPTEWYCERCGGELAAM